MTKCINTIQQNGSTAKVSPQSFSPGPQNMNSKLKKHGERPLYEAIRFTSGYEMIIANHRRAKSLRMCFDHDLAPVSFCYNLTQRARCTVISGTKVKRTFERGAGDGVLAYLPQTRGILESPQGENVVGVSLFFPLDIFTELFSEVPQLFGLICKRKAGVSGEHGFYHQTKVDGVTRLVLKQILQCPYGGGIRKLFLEAKSLELVALKLAELGPANHSDTSEPDKREMELVQEAFQIILDKLAAPPSLVELSRMVGVNRNKLNRGFKKVYGDTVFNILRNTRLTRACYLLQNSELSLPEIAYSIGYNSQANFTTAFRQHFGQTPKNVRQNGLARLGGKQISLT